MSIRRRHEEYTSITDSISVRHPERRIRNNRSNSSEHDESAVDSDGNDNLMSSPRKRSTRDLRMTPSSQAEESTSREPIYEMVRFWGIKKLEKKKWKIWFFVFENSTRFLETVEPLISQIFNSSSKIVFMVSTVIF